MGHIPSKSFMDSPTLPPPVVGTINLKVSLGAKEIRVSRMAKSVVVKLDSAYNTLFRQPKIHGFKAVPSLYH